jgi:hypothetical protein
MQTFVSEHVSFVQQFQHLILRWHLITPHFKTRQNVSFTYLAQSQLQTTITIKYVCVTEKTGEGICRASMSERLIMDEQVLTAFLTITSL